MAYNTQSRETMTIRDLGEKQLHTVCRVLLGGVQHENNSALLSVSVRFEVREQVLQKSRTISRNA